MFSFSRKRMKLGRLKVQLSDGAQGTRSPIPHPKRNSSSNGQRDAPTSSLPDKLDYQCSSSVSGVSNRDSGNAENWMVLSISGEKPTPRFNHAATVIGNQMVVVGGESGNGPLDDVQVLDFDSFTWSTVSSKLYMSSSTLPLKIPACKGHSLVSWEKKVLLIGGKTEPGSDKVSVWAHHTEMDCWSLMEAKGDVPVSRSGHTVVRSNSVLILFGGEDVKRRKLNDLHMFDLKSLTWLPLHCTGTGPSPRSNHVTALYNKTLLIFGGTSKSRTLNDLYSLDFETMVWSRIKVRGFHPSPRAGCCGVLCGTKWYIAGGGSRKKRHTETLVFDVLKLEWSDSITSPQSSVTSYKGFSMVLVQHKEKDFLLAFGGTKKEASNQVEVLTMEKDDLSSSQRSLPSKVPGSLLFETRLSSTGIASQLSNGSSHHSVDTAPRQNLASVIGHGSGRKSLSETLLVDSNPVSSNVSLRKQHENSEEYDNIVKISRCPEDACSSQGNQQKICQSDIGIQDDTGAGKFNAGELPSNDNENLGHEGIGNLPYENDDIFSNNSKPGLSTSSSSYQYYEVKMASLIRKNGVLEGQLAAAVAGREAAEKNLSSALKSRQEMEKKLSETSKQIEMLREKLAAVELAQEEANSLSNIVHSDNVRLEHDVAFLKAVLDDTQKELHSTRGVLAGERARAFQLQVEVFHLKQRLQSMENRAPTPRKPFQV